MEAKRPTSARREHEKDKEPRQALRLGARDVAILADVAQQRLLTAELLSWRHFPPRQGAPAWERERVSPAAQRRLLQLAQAGYLARLTQPVWPGTGGAPLAYSIAELGAATLSRLSGEPVAVPGALSPLSMDHTLGVARVWAALAVGCARTQNLTLHEWVGESGLRRREAALREHERRLVGDAGERRPIPDGTCILTLDGADQVRLFVEVDQGTETQAAVAAKLEDYAEYRLSAQYRAAYGDGAWLLLWVSVGPRRLAHVVPTLARVAQQEQAGVLRGRVLCTSAALTPGTVLGPIWVVAGSGERRALVRAGLRLAQPR